MDLGFEIKEDGQLSFPEHPAVIEEGKYQGRDDITSVSIPSSVYKISKNAFANCKNLRRVNLGESISTIEEGAFSGCENLSSIYLPPSLTYIADDAFDGCFEQVRNYQIYGYKGTYAEKFVNESCSLSFCALVDEDELEQAKERFDKNIDTERQVLFFQEARKNEFNTLIASKANAYLALAILLGKGTAQSFTLADWTMSIADSYYEFKRFSSVVDETEEEKFRQSERHSIFYNGFAKTVREMIEDVLLEKKSVAQCKKELYPDEMREEEKTLCSKMGEEQKKDEEELKSKDPSFRILYLHDLSESKFDPMGLYLKDKLPYAFKLIDIPSDPYYGLLKVRDTVNEYHPDLIVASGFSCIYALGMRSDFRILVHPSIDTQYIRNTLKKDIYPYQNGHLGIKNYIVDSNFLELVEELAYMEKEEGGFVYSLFNKEKRVDSSYQMLADLFKEENISMLDDDSDSTLKNELMTLIKRVLHIALPDREDI